MMVLIIIGFKGISTMSRSIKGDKKLKIINIHQKNPRRDQDDSRLKEMLSEDSVKSGMSKQILCFVWAFTLLVWVFTSWFIFHNQSAKTVTVVNESSPSYEESVKKVEELNRTNPKVSSTQTSPLKINRLVVDPSFNLLIGIELGLFAAFK